MTGREEEEAPPISGVTTKRKPKLVEVAWVEEGMTVWLRWNHPPNSALRCTVAVAAGDHARVVNERVGLARWQPLHMLFVEEGDLHAYRSG